MDDYIIEKKRKREREEEEELYARMKKNLREFEANEQLKIKERMRRYFELQANQKIDYKKIEPRYHQKLFSFAVYLMYHIYHNYIVKIEKQLSLY